jgi:hypothetical protein
MIKLHKEQLRKKLAEEEKRVKDKQEYLLGSIKQFVAIRKLLKRNILRSH